MNGLFRNTNPRLLKKVKFQYKNDKEKYSVCEKMPIIATTNLKEKHIYIYIYNTMEFQIWGINQINDKYFQKIHLQSRLYNRFVSLFIKIKVAK